MDGVSALRCDDVTAVSRQVREFLLQLEPSWDHIDPREVHA